MAAALLERRPEQNLGELGRWLDDKNVALAGLTPANWIREGRDATILGDAWVTGAARLSRRSQPAIKSDLKRTLDQLRLAERLFSGLDIGSLTNISNAISQVALRGNLATELMHAQQMLQAASLADQISPVVVKLNQSLRGPMAGYLAVAEQLSAAERNGAFAGARDTLAALKGTAPMLGQTGLLSRLVGDIRPAIGAFAIGMDLQLSTALAGALLARPALRSPFLEERVGWQHWLPEHPAALTRTEEIETDWLVGETHNATQASVAALGRHAGGVDGNEVSSAMLGVTIDFPDLLSMKVPGTGTDMRAILNGLAPRVVRPLEGALDRLRGGGADDARQASASMRAGLDKLAAELVPGPKKGRASRYAELLGVRVGDPAGRLLYHQIEILYASYQPLSDAIHDDLDIDAVRVNAYGTFSAMAAVISKWFEGSRDS